MSAAKGLHNEVIRMPTRGDLQQLTHLGIVRKQEEELQVFCKLLQEKAIATANDGISVLRVGMPEILAGCYVTLQVELELLFPDCDVEIDAHHRQIGISWA